MSLRSIAPETEIALKLADYLQEVLEAGKVKAIGVSELSTEEAKRIHSVVPVSAIEIEWNLFNRDCEVRTLSCLIAFQLLSSSECNSLCCTLTAHSKSYC